MGVEVPDNQEGGKQLVKLMLDADAAQMLLQLAGGPRKQGDYVSKLIRLVASGDLGPAVQMADKLGAVERELSELARRVDAIKGDLHLPS